ncbi:hypothetical protein HY496_00445 [Candidatus Woesearchaeota archaeon]|nr:hypothetical protein [Candidatus Woesearchaeota archaeon]
MSKYRFSTRFYLGIILIVFSLIIGKITSIIFIFYFSDAYLRWISAIVYVLSWVPFIIGIWWVGHEYSEGIKKYFSYKYYHQAVKLKAGKAITKTRELHQHVRNRMKSRKKKSLTPMKP